MKAAPRPSALLVLIRPESDIDEQRNFSCGHYDACLDDAISHEWTSWTCAGCGLFGQQRTSSDAPSGRETYGMASSASAEFS